MKTWFSEIISGGSMKKISFFAVAVISLACFVLPFTASAADKLVVKDSGGTNTVFNVDDTGLEIVNKVGVGSSVFNDVSSKIAAGSNTFTVFELASHNNSNQSPSYITMISGGTDTSPTISGASNIIGSFIFRGHDGTAYRNAGMIRATIDGTPAASSMPGRITFHTVPSGSTALAERMRIDNAGNVGIGTTAPSQKLEVNGGMRLNTATAKPVCDANARGTVWLTQGSTDDIVEVCVKVSGSLVWKKLLW